MVFVGAAGGDIDQWPRQVHEIDKYARVVTYDRAGLGKTENTGTSRSLKGMTDELHHFLERDEIPAPYILVAHALGGGIIRYFQYLYPENVAGMVFIDAIRDDSYKRYEDFPEAKQAWFDRIDWLSSQYPGGIADESQALKHREQFHDTMRIICYPENVPLKIINSMLIDEKGIIDELIKNRSDSLFKSMAEANPLVEYIATDKSDHFIHLREPVLVNEAVIKLINEIRKE